MIKWAEFKKQAKEERKNRKEAADTSSVANENVDVDTDAENNWKLIFAFMENISFW